MLALLPRQALHAARIEFPHPHTGDEMTFEAPMPSDYAGVIEVVREAGA
jgi:23S rRNA pseudouridine1911/1915/1917 synthase